ncbi:MAG: Hsp70 family protein, partial [Lachnospiraceae bacterium]
VPQIDVTFDIDANGILTVSAQDQASGKMKSITITASDRMSEDEVMEARAKAQIYQAQDELRRKGLALYQDCQELLTRSQAISGDKKRLPDKNARKELTRLEKELSRAMSRFRADKIAQEMLDGMQQAKTALETALTPYQ